jgi:cysteine-rich repeat protein
MGAIALSGCSGTECGAGTFEEDGKCMPEIAADSACAEGTKLVDKQCVLDESGCGTDAILDEETGTCEPAPDFCADGTMYDQGSDKCVANTEVVCGDDTVANAEGVCEPAVDQICGDKTTADENGRCVIAADACESGEIIDPNSGDCVATDTYCSDTTAFDTDSGTCVPTADVCDTGTAFDDESGLCLPDACQTGDVLLNGVCVGPAEALADEADASSAENDDPAFGGTAVDVTVEPIGDTAVFTGTIGEPSDLNSDGDVDQDADVFQFSATAGQWFNVAVQSTGLPAPAFKIEGPNGFERYSGFGMAPARKIVIPRDGDYTMTVLPESVLASEGDVGPAGSAEWGYVASLEQIDAPTATTVDLTSNDITGSYADLSDNLIEVNGFSAGDLVNMTVDASGDDAEGVVQVWAGATDFRSSRDISEGDEFSLIVPSSGTLLLLLDWETATGPALDFGLSGELDPSFEPLGSIASDDSVDAPSASFADGDVKTYTFTVGSGQVIEIFHNNDEDEEIDLTLLDSNGNELLDQTFVDDIDDSDSDYNYWYTESGGTFVAEVEATTALTNEVVTITSSTPNDLGSVGIGDDIDATVTSALDENRSEYHLLTATADVQVNGTITANGGNELDGSIYLTNNDLVVDLTTADPLTINGLNATAGMYLVRVEAADAGITEYTVDMTFTEAPQLEVEPNDTVQDAAPYDPSDDPLEGSSADDTDVDVYAFSPANDLGADEVLFIDMRQTVPAADEYSCRLEDASGTVLSDNGTEGIENGCTLFASGLLASSTYYVVIERENGSDSEAYTIASRIETGVTEVEPNDDQASASSITFADLISGTTTYGRLFDDPDVDYFTFNVASDRDPDEVVTFDVGLLGPDSVLSSNVEIELISASDGSVASGDISSPLTATGLTAGDYFIRLERTDGSSWNSTVYGLDANAVVPVCGNGTVEPGEDCDDGNTATGDGCDDTCAIEFDVCGNNIVETGEDCDDGPNGSAYCSTTCTINPTTTTASNSPAAAISSSIAPTTDTVSVSGCTTIAATTVDVDISHTWRSDLVVTLTSPTGTDVVLWNNDGGSASDVIGNFPVDFAPDESLDSLNGESGNGTWTVTVADEVSGDDGTLNSWGVNLWCN